MGLAKIADVLLRRSWVFAFLVVVFLLWNKAHIGPIFTERIIVFMQSGFIVFGVAVILFTLLKNKFSDNTRGCIGESVLELGKRVLEIAMAFAVYGLSYVILEPYFKYDYFQGYMLACCAIGLWAAVNNSAISCLKASIVSFVLTPIIALGLVNIFGKNRSKEEAAGEEENKLIDSKFEKKLGIGVAIGIFAILIWATVGDTFEEMHIKRGDELCAQQNFNEAIKEYGMALKFDPNNVATYIKRGNAYKAKGYREGAISDYSKVIELDPENVEAYMKRGMLYYGNHEYHKAVEDYGKVIELDPENVDAYLERGRVFSEWGRNKYHEAAADYSKAIELNPQNIKAYIRRAIIYVSMKNYEGALADSNKILEIDSENSRAYGIRGEVRKAQKDYGNAIADFTKAIQWSSSGVSRYYYERGDIYRLMSDREHAAADALKTSEPRSTFSSYGDRCYEMKNYFDAIFYYTETIRRQSYDNEEWMVKRGNAYRFVGDYVQAAIDYGKAIKAIGPLDKEKIAQLVIEDSKEAREAVKEAVKLSGLLYDAYFGRAYIYQQQQDFLDAIEDYTRAIEYGFDSTAAAYNNRGNCYSSQGDDNRAIADYTKAIEEDPREAMYYNNRGKSHRKLGNIAQAEADFARARQL